MSSPVASHRGCIHHVRPNLLQLPPALDSSAYNCVKPSRPLYLCSQSLQTRMLPQGQSHQRTTSPTELHAWKSKTLNVFSSLIPYWVTCIHRQYKQIHFNNNHYHYNLVNYSLEDVLTETWSPTLWCCGCLCMYLTHYYLRVFVHIVRRKQETHKPFEKPQVTDRCFTMNKADIEKDLSDKSKTYPA